jgi:hypothetical protein
LMHNKTFAAEIAHNVSSRNRTTIIERYVSWHRFGSQFCLYFSMCVGLRFWVSRSPTPRLVCGQRSRVSSVLTFQHSSYVISRMFVYAHASIRDYELHR